MSAVLLPFSHLQGRRLHLGVCGSIAAYKAVDILRALQRVGIEVSVTLTTAACRFITPLTFESLGADPVHTDLFRSDGASAFGHLQPGRVAEAFLIAPATATTIARLATGMADNMLAAQALAFDGPVTIAPAMNPRMWRHPATQRNVRILMERGCRIVGPAGGIVACGDTGAGKLDSVDDIVFSAVSSLLPQDMEGKSVLLTLGPTREPWDSVRVWTNLSTGRMGAALAQAAALRGAAVHAVAGPGVPELPSVVTRHDVTTARQMFDTAAELWPSMDIGLFSAAVADFSPVVHGPGKFKKASTDNGFSVEFTPNPDILATLGHAAAAHQRLLGFAAETASLEDAARGKLQRKKAHMIVGNLVGVQDSGFAAESNRVFVCDYHGREDHWPVLSKADVAWRLLDWLLTL